MFVFPFEIAICARVLHDRFPLFWRFLARAILEAFWSFLEGLGGILRASWGASWGILGGLGRLLGGLGELLGHLGGILEASWGILEASWGVLRYLRVILETS